MHATVIPMTHKPLSEFFVASCVPDGGVYRYRLYDDGRVEALQKIPMDCPMFLAEQNGIMYAILRAPFPGSNDSGLLCVDANGEPIGKLHSTHGEVACHLTVCQGDVWCSNYISGSVFKLPEDLLVAHSGHSVHPTRQTAPHVHSAFLSPDGTFLLVCDLGMDSVFVYTRDLELVSVAKTPAGAGPRHLCFSQCGKFVYCINEMGGSISVFAWDNGSLCLLETVSILPPDFKGEGAGAAIKLSADGTILYATERASRTVVTLTADGARLAVLSHTDCGGEEPRDFTLLAGDRFAVSANQFGNNITIFRRAADGTLSLLNRVELPAPLCVIETEHNAERNKISRKEGLTNSSNGCIINSTNGGCFKKRGACRKERISDGNQIKCQFDGDVV